MVNLHIGIGKSFKYKWLFFLLLALINMELYGQNEKSDPCNEGLKLFRSANFKHQPEESISIYNKVLEIIEKAGCWKEQVYVLNGLATINYNKKKYGQSKLYARKAVELSKQHLGENSVEYASSLFNLSSSFEELGDFNRSISSQKKAADIFERLGEEDYQTAIISEGVGMSYKKLGDIDLAIPYFEKAIKLFAKTVGTESYDFAAELRLIGSCYMAKNDLDIAIEYYEKALPILNKIKPDEYTEQIRWDVCRGIAEAHYKSGNKEKSLYYFDKALAIQVEYNFLQNYSSYLEYGNIHLKEGNFELAEQLFLKANQEAKDEYKIYSRKMELAMPILGLANLYAKKENFEKALDHYKEALELITFDFVANDVYENPPVQQFINKLEALQILEGKADLLTDLYKTKKDQNLLMTANETWLLAAQLIQEIRQSYLEQGSKHNLIDKVHAIYGKAVEAAVELHRVSGENKYLEDALFFAESNKAVLFYESLKNEMAKRLAGIPDSLLEKEKSLLVELNFYEKKILEDKQMKTAGKADLIKQWKEKVFDLKNEYQGHIKMLEENYPVYLESKQQTKPLALNELRQKLPNAETAIIEFMLTEKNGVVFFLTTDELFVHEIDKDFLLQENIDQLRQIIISSPQSNEQLKKGYLVFSDVGFNLFQHLLKPGLLKLGNKINHLIFVPDGSLNYIPLELLLYQEPENKNYYFNELSYLFKKYKVSYNYSASLINANSNNKETKKENKSFIGFAPDFGNNKIAASRVCIENDLYGLQCNKSEVTSINSLWKGDIYTGLAASVDSFKNASNNYDIIHLATHACIDEKEPTLNKIYFSGGSITQLELNSLKLNAELTVLSACNTGSGKIQKGEGVMSLARSFIMAGSKSVLTSLWSVDDCATSEIMVNYYTCLKKGMAKDEAIAQAKMIYLDSADVNDSHPYYWGAFVQFGSVEAIVSEDGWIYFWTVGLGLLILIGGYYIGRKKGVA